MEKTIEIKYWWDTERLPDLSIDVLDQLEQEALGRVYEMWMEGYIAGELSTQLLTSDDEECSIRGGWSLSHK